jgi:transcription elongation factor GreB
MGTRTRTRPDESKKPGPITPEGFEKLQQEANFLWFEERPRVQARVTAAAAEGDRSENAEYIYGKRRMAQIDSRLRFLGNRMDAVRVITDSPADDGRVHFGCWVDLEDDDGELRRYRIVGADESDAERGFISIDSPVARALLNRQVDDEVLVRRPKGDATFYIVAIHAREPAD